MKALILMALLAAPAGANEFCGNLADAAGSIMDARQKGVPMHKLMPIINENEARDIMKLIVVEAYESPIYSSDKYKDRAISEMSNRVYLTCLKGVE